MTFVQKNVNIGHFIVQKNVNIGHFVVQKNVKKWDFISQIIVNVSIHEIIFITPPTSLNTSRGKGYIIREHGAITWYMHY